jgi:hypothetical protein
MGGQMELSELIRILGLDTNAAQLLETYDYYAALSLCQANSISYIQWDDDDDRRLWVPLNNGRLTISEDSHFALRLYSDKYDLTFNTDGYYVTNCSVELLNNSR